MTVTKPTQKPRKMRQRSIDAAGRRVTMTDIAREAGCSQTTVSIVLNRTEGIKISEQTRQRVLGTLAARCAERDIPIPTLADPVDDVAMNVPAQSWAEAVVAV
jgi:hypothetical protein